MLDPAEISWKRMVECVEEADPKSPMEVLNDSFKTARAAGDSARIA